LCDGIINKIPELRQIFSYILCQEDMIFTESYLIKDMSILLHNRKIEDIIIVETDPTRVDSDILSTLNPLPYDGSLHYG
jgi:TFIIF-interacting CTD phosphatase-like protein